MEFYDKDIYTFLKLRHIKTENGIEIDFKNHKFLRDIYEDFSPKQAILKAAQIGFCLWPKTEVLKADYTWEYLENIKVGDKLISVDEDHGGGMQGRKKRVSIVEGKREIKEDSVWLKMENGKTLIATPEHRFLAKRRGATDTLWKKVKDLKIGDELRFFCETWRDGDYEDGWIGGIIDGEGSLRKKTGTELTIVQSEGVVLDRVKKYFDRNGLSYRLTKRGKNRGGLGNKVVYDITTSNTAEIFKIIGKTRPIRFVNRTDWWEGSCIGRDKNKKSWYKIISIEKKEKRKMIDIQTSTKTFIADGFVSHNSTTEIIKSLWLARMRGINIIYTLPTESDRNDFVSGKVNKIIANNPIFQEWTKDKDAVEQKQVGKSTIYYRGTWTQKAAIMVSSDLNVYDELDASKSSVVEQYSTRLQHSDLKWEWFFSHPSAEGSGIDRVWQRSTQSHWFIKCHHCNEEQFMSWPESIDQDKQEFICKYCHKTITNEDRINGRWVKKYKDREYQGYWIPLLIAPWITAKDILGYYKDKSEEYFYNKVLGLPYVGGGNKLTKANLMQNLTSTMSLPEKDDRVIIGVDTGKKLHYVIGSEKGLFHYSTAKDYDEIEALFRRWPRAVAVIDQGGDLIGSRKLREKFPGKVYLCSFGADRKTLELVRWGKNDEDGVVVADRNRIIQMLVDEFTSKRIPLYGDENDWHEYWLHWNNLTRIKEFDEKTQTVKRHIWQRSGEDHWALATAYYRVGVDRFSSKAELISSSQFKPKNTVELW